MPQRDDAPLEHFGPAKRDLQDCETETKCSSTDAPPLEDDVALQHNGAAQRDVQDCETETRCSSDEKLTKELGVAQELLKEMSERHEELLKDNMEAKKAAAELERALHCESCRSKELALAVTGMGAMVQELAVAVNVVSMMNQDLTWARQQAEENASWAYQQTHQLTTRLSKLEEDLRVASRQNSKLQEKLRSVTEENRQQELHLEDLELALLGKTELIQDLAWSKGQTEEKAVRVCQQMHEMAARLCKKEEDLGLAARAITELQELLRAEREDRQEEKSKDLNAFTRVSAERQAIADEVARLKSDLRVAQTEKEKDRMEIVKLGDDVLQAKVEAEQSVAKLEELGIFFAELHKDFAGMLMDPISLQPMRDPMVAADLHTYDRASIEAWHKVSPTSPHTRAPMAITTLRSNKIAMWLGEDLEKMVKVGERFWPGKAWREGIEPEVRDRIPDQVQDELQDAIEERDQELAVELLARPVEDIFINGTYEHKGQQWTLLEYALVLHLPEVARAVAARADFRMGLCHSCGANATHLATALGIADVCRSLVRDFGANILKFKTTRQIFLESPTGEIINIPRHFSCWDLARSLKNEALLAAFKELEKEFP